MEDIKLPIGLLEEKIASKSAIANSEHLGFTSKDLPIVVT
jgi:hypothetical protein